MNQMKAKSFFNNYFLEINKKLNCVDINKLEEISDLLVKASKNNNKIIIVGNGGSAATASHFANDFAFGTNDYEKPFKVMSITDNVPVLTALGNDYGYDEIFIRQLKVYGRKGDVLVGISASGNSQNLINAFEYATTVGIKTVALTAFDGGKMRKIANQCVHIPTGKKEYGPAEDLHMILDHLVANYLMRFVK